jgi:hypothetical protein
LKSRTIFVRVGAEEEEYHIYENLLRANSGFFDIALKKEWKEGQDRIVEMLETNNEAFSIWAKWLYTGCMYLMKDGDIERTSEGVTTNREWPRWASCYAFGDFLQDSDFKDTCIDSCIEAIVVRASSPYSLASWIYSCSAGCSSHRKLAVDVFVHCWARTGWTRDIKHPAEFLSDVIKAIGPNVSSGIKAQDFEAYFDLKNTCEYHDHGPEKPCYKSKPAFRF